MTEPDLDATTNDASAVTAPTGTAPTGTAPTGTAPTGNAQAGDSRTPDVTSTQTAAAPPALPSVRSVAVATVLFRPEPAALAHWLRVVRRTAQTAIEERRAASVTVLLGDCTPEAAPAVAAAVSALPEDDLPIRVTYTAFAENLGHSEGTNRLLDRRDEEAFWILNPDAYPAPAALSRMLGVLATHSADVLDARQLPCEHPAWFDPRTGLKSWASGAALLLHSELWRRLDGFDAEHFWSYCNDVDLSWRARLLGGEARHVASATVYHDKRVDERGIVRGTATQDHYGIIGRLMLCRRFDRPDVEEATIRYASTLGSRGQIDGVRRFRELVAAGAVPSPEPGARSVAQFVGGDYEKRRF